MYVQKEVELKLSEILTIGMILTAVIHMRSLNRSGKRSTRKRKKWYHIVAVDNEDGYQAVVVNNHLVLEVRPSKEKRLSP